jgi:dolichol-phosphate mannosyltransferase
MDGERPTLSVVAPAFNEADNLERFHEEVEAVLDGLGLSWELILVDDGSRDATWEAIRALHARDPRVRGVRFSRNFGHQYALLAGLSRARGDAVVSMDADLQHPPPVIAELVAEWRKGSTIVHTVRRDPETVSWFKRVSSRLFYRLFSFLSGTHLSAGMADFRLLDRQVVRNLLDFPEEGLFLRGLVHWIGFPSSSVTFECQPRFAGTTSYTLKKMLRFAWTGVTSFSLVPLRLSILLGFVTSLFAFEQGVEAVYRKLVLHETVPGWAQLMVVSTLLFGVLFIMLGIVGEYVGRVLVEVRRRPRFIVREELGAPTPQAASCPVQAGSSGACLESGSKRPPEAHRRSGSKSRVMSPPRRWASGGRKVQSISATDARRAARSLAGRRSPRSAEAT